MRVVAGIYWREVRITLLAWLAALSLLGMVLMLALYHQKNAEEALLDAEKHWQHAQQQALLYANYQPDISDYLVHRDQWQASGLMQLPDVNRWEAAWANLQQQSSLPHLTYQIQPSINCLGGQCRQQSRLSHLPEINVTVTPIHLSWRVHHESEISAWLQALQLKYYGMLLVDHCQWELADSADAIATQCDLTMFNFPNVLSMPGSS